MNFLDNPFPYCNPSISSLKYHPAGLVTKPRPFEVCIKPRSEAHQNVICTSLAQSTTSILNFDDVDLDGGTSNPSQVKDNSSKEEAKSHRWLKMLLWSPV
jgi:hypothetical protein